MFKFKSIAKVRISEDNTKQKNTFLYLLSSERMQSHTLNLQVKELSTKSKLHNSTDITKYKYKIIFYSFGGIYAELIRNRSFEDGPRYGAPTDMQGWSTHSATPSQLTARLIQPSKKTPLLNSVQHYVVRLAANDGMDENTLDTPTAIHPVEQLLSPENGCIPLDEPSYSLNIVRIK